MSETPTSPPREGSRTGSIKAGGTIRADTIVTGTQIQGGDAATVQAILAVQRTFQQTGSIEAVQDIIARNIVTGLQYIGQNNTPPTVEQFQRELGAVQRQLQQAIQDKEIADPDEAEEATRAVERAMEQSKAEKPVAERISSRLDSASTIITKAATAAEAAEKLQAGVIKLAPILTLLRQLVPGLWP